jgi:glycerophosphoryl diester phosphodiesterase
MRLWFLALFALACAGCDPEGLGRPNPNFLVIGHRGAPLLAAENTLPSFDIALALGANAIETDLCVTRDGVIVVWHDRDPDSTVALARQSGAEDQAFIPLVPPLGSSYRRPVEELTLAELRAHYGYGDLSGNKNELAVIPTFQDLLGWAASHAQLSAVYLDVKLSAGQTSEATALISELAATLQGDAALSERRFFALSVERSIASAMEAEREFQAAEQVRVALDSEGLGALDGTRDLGLRDVSTGLVPQVAWGDFKEEVADLVDARERGSIDSVTVWTFDKEIQLAELLYYSVDGVMTNDPATLYTIWQDTLE